MFRDSGSEKRSGPRYDSLQGLHDVKAVVTPHTMSQFRLTSTPSHEVPALSRRFCLHKSSTVMTCSRPSGLAHGSSQTSSTLSMILISRAGHVLPPSVIS